MSRKLLKRENGIKKDMYLPLLLCSHYFIGEVTLTNYGKWRKARALLNMLTAGYDAKQRRYVLP
ncbi:hypothetical protein [Paenibacillus illinoisensis]|nr:hypothetical protein [Paenibacillus illinoisensis]